MSQLCGILVFGLCSQILQRQELGYWEHGLLKLRLHCYQETTGLLSGTSNPERQCHVLMWLELWHFSNLLTLIGHQLQSEALS